MIGLCSGLDFAQPPPKAARAPMTEVREISPARA
jgi:hypothetical protein